MLAETAGTGRAGLDVALEVALARGAGGPLDVDGALFLDGNDVTFGRADLTLEGARGSIGFSERGVRIGNLRATLFDRPVAIDAATSGEGAEALTEVRLGGAVRGVGRPVPLRHSARSLRRRGVALERDAERAALGRARRPRRACDCSPRATWSAPRSSCRRRSRNRRRRPCR